jgi:hypothetical protein
MPITQVWLTVIAGLLGTILVQWLTAQRDKKRREHELKMEREKFEREFKKLTEELHHKSAERWIDTKHDQYTNILDMICDTRVAYVDLWMTQALKDAPQHMRSLYDSPEACLEHYELVLNSRMTAIHAAMPQLEFVASKKFYRGSSKVLEYMSELAFAIGYSQNDANEIRLHEDVESYASAIDNHYRQLFDTMRIELGLKKPEIYT